MSATEPCNCDQALALQARVTELEAKLAFFELDPSWCTPEERAVLQAVDSTPPASLGQWIDDAIHEFGVENCELSARCRIAKAELARRAAKERDE